MSRDPVMLALPPFFGFTRRLVIAASVAWLVAVVLSLTLSGMAALLLDQSALHPSLVLHEPWQLATYPFALTGLVSTALALLSVWFFGSALEEERGAPWLREFFWVATIGGALLSVVLSRTVFAGVAQLAPQARVSGMWPISIAMLLAYARFFPDRELRLYFVLRVKAKFLAIGFLLIYFAEMMTSGGRFDAMVTVCVCVAGYLYLQFAPRRGLRFAGSEWWFGMRNRYVRSKRKRAAKKFTVYMRKQGKDVNLDASGKYISLEDERRDSNDKSWMN
jgi:membrane associated rhomboid family serine protease